jgi:hypothetical protein
VPQDRTQHKRIDGAWVAYLDAFGFADAVEKRPEPQIDKFFLEIHESLVGAKAIVAAVYQFSDSIFVIQESHPEPDKKLENLIIATQNLQRIALQSNLVFRGVVAFGPVTIAPFGCYGEPVVEAARLESHLAAPLVIIPRRYIERANDHLRNVYSPTIGLGIELPMKTIRTKTGLIDANIFPPPLRLFSNIAHKKIRESLTNGPDHIAPAWQFAIAALGPSDARGNNGY